MSDDESDSEPEAGSDDPRDEFVEEVTGQPPYQPDAVQPAAFEELEQEVHTLENTLAERDEEITQLKRALADERNDLQRAKEKLADQREDIYTETLRDLVSSLSVVRESLNHAERLAEGEVERGIHSTISQFDQTMASFDVTVVIPDAGDSVDPNKHNVLMHAPSEDIPEGDIVDTFAPGYKHDGVVFEPAGVTVSSGPDDEDADATEDGDGSEPAPEESGEGDPRPPNDDDLEDFEL
jgi:molecular chaperone GrpE